jgi:hypothetical protein
MQQHKQWQSAIGGAWRKIKAYITALLERTRVHSKQANAGLPGQFIGKNGIPKRALQSASCFFLRSETILSATARRYSGGICFRTTRGK